MLAGKLLFSNTSSNDKPFGMSRSDPVVVSYVPMEHSRYILLALSTYRVHSRALIGPEGFFK